MADVTDLTQGSISTAPSDEPVVPYDAPPVQGGTEAAVRAEFAGEWTPTIGREMARIKNKGVLCAISPHVLQSLDDGELALRIVHQGVHSLAATSAMIIESVRVALSCRKDGNLPVWGSLEANARLLMQAITGARGGKQTDVEGAIQAGIMRNDGLWWPAPDHLIGGTVQLRLRHLGHACISVVNRTATDQLRQFFNVGPKKDPPLFVQQEIDRRMVLASIIDGRGELLTDNGRIALDPLDRWAIRNLIEQYYLPPAKFATSYPRRDPDEIADYCRRAYEDGHAELMAVFLQVLQEARLADNRRLLAAGEQYLLGGHEVANVREYSPAADPVNLESLSLADLRGILRRFFPPIELRKTVPDEPKSCELYLENIYRGFNNNLLTEFLTLEEMLRQDLPLNDREFMEKKADYVLGATTSAA